MGSIQKQKAIIIGSGVYGMSTALWMLKDGGYEVTILDKCETVPAPDAASTDLNKIIRAGDYIDPAYAALGIEAVEMWKQPEWEGTYHESGVLNVTTADNAVGATFINQAYKNLRSANIDAVLCSDLEAIKSRFDPSIPLGDFANKHMAYANPVGGWAEAARGVEAGHKQVKQLGGEIRPGCEVVKLLVDGKKVQGVVLKSGEEIRGDLVVCAAGSWTPQLFASIGLARAPEVVATGHSLACVQLTPEEAKRYSSIPVILAADDGFYVFPPNADNLVKFSIHDKGYTNPKAENGNISVPRTKLTPGAEDGMIPIDQMQALRRGLAAVYPELAKKELVHTRICWYCDTKHGDWLIDYHPDFENLVVASGDSGHGYKYAPLIGREILKVIQRQGDPRFVERWSFDWQGDNTGADIKAGTTQVLQVDQLTTKEHLKARA